MSEALSKTTCRIHYQRPASARCPGCEQFYCSECITEHDGRLTCASCLEKARIAKLEENETASKSGQTIFQPVPLVHFGLGLVVIWVVFYLIARVLTGIPDSFHDGTIWK